MGDSGLRVLDPYVETANQGCAPMTPAHPEQQNSRTTFRVPNPDRSTLSMGIAAGSAGVSQTGIMGQTDSHVRFRARTGNTGISLGVAPSGASSTCEAVPGYSMWTDGKKQERVVGDVLLEHRNTFERTVDKDTTLRFEAGVDHFVGAGEERIIHLHEKETIEGTRGRYVYDGSGETINGNRTTTITGSFSHTVHGNHTAVVGGNVHKFGELGVTLTTPKKLELEALTGATLFTAGAVTVNAPFQAREVGPKWDKFYVTYIDVTYGSKLSVGLAKEDTSIIAATATLNKKDIGVQKLEDCASAFKTKPADMGTFLQRFSGAGAFLQVGMIIAL